MAGKSKKRIDYAGWSVDIFSNDIKIDKLLDAHGWIGFGVYFYLCQMAFGGEGYYYEWGYDLCASTARKMGGGVGSGTVKETVDYCLQIGLFDKGLFDGWGVLTSRGIQKSYLAVVKGNSRRTVEIYKEYWLLDISKKEDCQGVVFIRKNSNKLVANGDLQGANTYSQGANSDSIVLKGMVGDSIVNNIPPISPFKGDECGQTKNSKTEKHRHGEYGHVLLTDLQLDKLFTDYGESNTQDAIKFLDEYIQMKGYKAKDHNLALRKWVFRAVEEEKQRNGGVKRVKPQQGNTSHSDESESDALAVFRASHKHDT